MIKTIKLEKLVFFILMFATIILAMFFLLTSEIVESASVFTDGEGEIPILIIDAGHGGEDGGATSLLGVTESTINLDIALKMAALADLTGLKYTMTRDSEVIYYPDSAKSISNKKVYDQKKRVELINNTSNAILISVHQNFFPHSSAFGPQTFYSKNSGSDTLSELIQCKMNSALCPGNRRVAAPVAKNIFIFKNISCPAVLVECGFISNPNEAELLNTEKHRLKIAIVLTSAYLQFLATSDK